MISKRKDKDFPQDTDGPFIAVVVSSIPLSTKKNVIKFGPPLKTLSRPAHDLAVTSYNFQISLKIIFVLVNNVDLMKCRIMWHFT